MQIAILGHMGRDEAMCERLMEHKLHIIGEWDNPGLVEKAIETGGTHHVIDSQTNTRAVADIVQAIEPDMFVTNFDDALAVGVVDVIKRRVTEGRMEDLCIPCPNQKAARVEWDKFYLREIVDRIDPSYNPLNFLVTNDQEVQRAIDFFNTLGIEVVVKPRNLSGGKGVKVQGKHFDTHTDAQAYAHEVLANRNQSGVEIQEKLVGHEFTLQIFTDGSTMIRPPATYDYPYRKDGDQGPGTGGMGAFSMPPSEHLPFVTDDDYAQVSKLMRSVLQELRSDGADYKGVLYPTFFKTAQGLKIVEINARGGDPELINICDLLEDDVSLSKALVNIGDGYLQPNNIRFKDMASAVIYLVAPEYGYSLGTPYDFHIHPNINQHDVKLRFAAAEQVSPNHYRTVGSSRSLALSALGDRPWDAREKIIAAIDATMPHTPLRYRRQIAEKAYIENLTIG